MATNRLNGSGSLNYMGVNAPQPPNLITMNRRPTVTDGVGFAIGTLWVIPQKDVGVEPQEETWILVGNRQGIFTWKRFRNSGGPTPPPSSVIINTIVNDVPGTYTYTPTSGMVQVTVELVGGGGGSTSWPAAGGGSIIMGEGGSGASYCKKTFNATTIGASQSFVVGAGGVTGGISDPTGGDGQASTFGSFMSAGGGFGGGNGGPPNPASLNGGTATGGDFNIPGCGRVDILSYSTVGQPEVQSHNTGGNSAMGFGVGGVRPTSGTNANQGKGYGAGAGGIFTTSDVQGLGAAGTGGIVIITEYF